MVYKVISLLCGSLNEGFSVGYSELQYHPDKWEHSNSLKSEYGYPEDLKQNLDGIENKAVSEFVKLHNVFGNYLSLVLKEFIIQNNLEYKVQLIAFKGFAVYNKTDLLTEVGNPGYIAAATCINVVADFATLNNALGANCDYQSSAAAQLLAEAGKEIQLALMAVLRWREENNFLSEKTGASRNSIGGAVWIGQEA